MRSAPASSGRSSHSAGSVPSPGIGLAARWLEHAADQRRRADRQRRPRRRGAGARPGRAIRPGSRTKKPRCLRASTRPARQQPVVGGDHRAGAHAVAPRAVAHRRQPRAGRQQALADALGVIRRQLLGQRASASRDSAVPGSAGGVDGKGLCGAVHRYRFVAVRLNCMVTVWVAAPTLHQCPSTIRPAPQFHCRRDPRPVAGAAGRGHLRDDAADDAPGGRPGGCAAVAAAVRHRRPRGAGRSAEHRLAARRRCPLAVAPRVAGAGGERGRARWSASRCSWRWRCARWMPCMPRSSPACCRWPPRSWRRLALRQRPSHGFWACAVLGTALVLGFAALAGGGRLSAADGLLRAGGAVCGHRLRGRAPRRSRAVAGRAGHLLGAGRAACR